MPSAEEFKVLKKIKSSFTASFTVENCKIQSITREENAREGGKGGGGRGGGAVAFAFTKWTPFLRDFETLKDNFVRCSINFQRQR